MTILMSICIPVYNGASYLDDALLSIKRQTFKDFEVVMVDDCSTDGSWLICERHARSDARFRVYRNFSNRGLVGNWNHAVTLAKSQWIKFLFQDDVMEPDCLARFMDAIKRSRSDLICCARRFQFEDDVPDAVVDGYSKRRFLTDIYHGKDYIPPAALMSLFVKRPFKNWIGEPSSFMIKKSLFGVFGYFDERLVQYCDYEYFLRGGCHVGIHLIPEILVSFRVHSSSATSANLSHRHFASHYLDWLSLLLKVRYDSVYAPLRSRVRLTCVPDVLRTLYLLRLRRANIVARKSESALKALSEFKKQYPQAAVEPLPSFVRLINQYVIWRICWWLRNLFEY